MLGLQVKATMIISFLFELALLVLPRFSHGVQEILPSQPSHWVEHRHVPVGIMFSFCTTEPRHIAQLAVPIKVPVDQTKGSQAHAWKVWGTSSSHN